MTAKKKAAAKLNDKIGRVSDASVFKGSGKHWHEWLALLDRAGARSWTHQEIVKHLKTKYKLSPWWQQGVTYGYEIGTGKRIDGQSLKGDYGVTCTKSLPVSAKKMWQTLLSEEGIEAWLQPLSPIEIGPKAAFECEGGIYGEIRTVKKGESIRFTWQDTEWPKSTTATLFIVKRPGEKCILAVSHMQIKTTALREQLRAHWKAALIRVAELIAK